MEFAEQVKTDYTRADLSRRERKIADFAVKVTRSPNACSTEDIEGLREEGLGDRDILSLTLIVTYYNMSNRFFEALSTMEP